MRIWVDAQISPRLASWIHEQFGIEADAVRDLGFRDASDIEIFQAARRADAVVLTQGRGLPASAPAARASSQGHLAHVWQHVQRPSEGSAQ